MKIFVVISKSMSDFYNFHRIIILVYGDTSSKNIKNFHLFTEELYARLYHRYMFDALSLLVC